MDYWDWVQDRIYLAKWQQLVEYEWEIGLYDQHLNIGDKQLPQVQTGLGSDVPESSEPEA